MVMMKTRAEPAALVEMDGMCETCTCVFCRTTAATLMEMVEHLEMTRGSHLQGAFSAFPNS